MTDRTANTANEAQEFARRARKNLEIIEQAADKLAGDASVHVVKQLTLSLLRMLGSVLLPSVGKSYRPSTCMLGGFHWVVAIAPLRSSSIG
jgi:hypothetical protein